VAKAHEASEVADAGRLLRKLQHLEGRVEGLLTKAERSGQLGPAASLVRELRELIRLFGEISGELEAAKVKLQVQVNAPRFVIEMPRRLSREEWLEAHAASQLAIAEADGAVKL